MENDISESIEAAAPTDNEEEEEDIIPVELDDTGGDGDGDEGCYFSSLSQNYGILPMKYNYK